MKFLVDRMLGRLATWLKVLGFDTVYFREPHSRKINYISLQERRIILTRNHKVSSKRSYSIIHIVSEQLEKQLKQVFADLNISVKEKLLFSRCTYCNVLVKSINKEHIYGKVPAYVYNTHAEFSTCPQCYRIYWKGTHDELLNKQIKEIGIPLENQISKIKNQK